MLRFTCGEKKIWQNIKKSQNIMKMNVDKRYKKNVFVRTTGTEYKHFQLLNIAQDIIRYHKISYHISFFDQI